MIGRNKNLQKQLFGFSRPINDLLTFSEGKPLHVFCKTPDAMILEINDLNAMMIAGRPRSEIIGKNFNDFVPSDKEYLWHNDSLAISSNSIKLFIENGLGRSFLSLKTQARDSNGNIIGVAGISFDLTQVGLQEIVDILNQLNLTTTSLFPFPHFIYSHLPLSDREKECSQYITRGMSAKKIANIMNISYRTVETHIAKIKYKLNCKTKSEIIDKIGLALNA